jgi:hypothetical protein
LENYNTGELKMDLYNPYGRAEEDEI